MDAPPPPPPPPLPLPSSTPQPQLHQSTSCFSTQNPANSIASNPNRTAEDPPSSSKPSNHGRKRKQKGAVKVAPSSSSCSSSSCPTQRGLRMALKQRSSNHPPKIRVGAVRRNEGSDMEAIALPLGMSFAAVVAQVLERKDAADDKISIDHLSKICTSAVKQSLTNVFGDKFDFFARNFEKSFGTTLRTLTLINESSANEGGCHLSNNLDTSTLDVSSSKTGFTNDSEINCCHSETDFATVAIQDSSTTPKEFEGKISVAIQDSLTTPEEVREKMFVAIQDSLSNPDVLQEKISENFIPKELVMHGQNNQLACASSSSLSSIRNPSVFSTVEKSVMEQVRSNDLKTLELGLVMKRLKLKETQLALNIDSNHLERSKLAMGVSKASFKAEKFKNQLEDTRHSELLKKCIDCLVAGIIIMSASLSYAAYVYSYKKISEATAACTPSPQESKSWWIPNKISSVSSGLHTIKCQVQVVSRMLFGFLMIITIAYLLLQRSGSSRQTMPITFILLLLGLACGFAGKLCVDTLGGSGYHWLLYWESLCLVHFFANTCTSALFLILHGPVNVSQGTKGNPIVPHWIRRSLFYATMLLFLPLVCGLLPFASFGEWTDHVAVLLFNDQSYASDWDEL